LVVLYLESFIKQDEVRSLAPIAVVMRHLNG